MPMGVSQWWPKREATAVAVALATRSPPLMGKLALFASKSLWLRSCNEGSHTGSAQVWPHVQGPELLKKVTLQFPAT